MITELFITDVTRMGQNRVCIAGVNRRGKSIRPTLPPPGIQEEMLYENGNCVIRPFMKMRLDLQECPIHPPHTEDMIMDLESRECCGILSPENALNLLTRILDPNVQSIFNSEIHDGCFISLGTGDRSLGTIKPAEISFVRHQLNASERWETKITFTDSQGKTFHLPVTDLSFRYYLDHLREVEKQTPGHIGLHLQQILNNANTFLRIGLARGFHPDKNQPQTRCYLQITGIYSFPDYLDGRCFADFSHH